MSEGANFQPILKCFDFLNFTDVTLPPPQFIFTRETPVAVSFEEELTNLRSENSFLRKENFELKEKVIGLEDKIRDLYRTIGDLQRKVESILFNLTIFLAPEDIINEFTTKVEDASLSSTSETGETKTEDKRWVAFAPTSYGQSK